MLVCTRKNGFTFIELVIVIIVVELLGAYAIAKYISMNKYAEQAAVESVIGSLRAAFNIYSSGQLARNQIIVIHNPFDDLGNKPPNYVGEVPDVNSSNCRPGEWAYQSGDPGANGNWRCVVYNPKETLPQGLPWEGKNWIVLDIKEIKDARGLVMGLNLDDYGTHHQW
jgi:prepilin-type N-terminal cleavage/methylation domain-containing protein